MDKAFLFLIIGVACFWLVLDNFYGNKYINKAVEKIIDI